MKRTEGMLDNSMTAVLEQHEAHIAVLRINGPLDSAVHDEVRRKVLALLSAGKRNILLDLARVSTANAAGLGVLADVYNMTKTAGGVLRLRMSRDGCASSSSTLALDLLTADGVFPIDSGSGQ
jgi:anti-sigma B factor antagonist